MRRRRLTNAERTEARRVFGDALDFDPIVVADDLGLGRRPWASCGLRAFTIHLGQAGYEDPLRRAFAPTFIHELVHVWQGQHGRVRFGYMLGSVVCQCRAFLTSLDVRTAYRYAPGKPWRAYNVEQQASIVEHWYAAGLKESNARFPCVRDHIRKGAR